MSIQTQAFVEQLRGNRVLCNERCLIEIIENRAGATLRTLLIALTD